MKALTVTVVVLLTAGLGGGCRDGKTKTEGGGGKTSSPQITQVLPDLDRLLAPVALYPDALLAQMLLMRPCGGGRRGGLMMLLALVGGGVLLLIVARMAFFGFDLPDWMDGGESDPAARGQVRPLSSL